MKILLDAQLPPAPVRFLGAGGHSAKHVQEVGLRHASDTLIWDYLLREGFILFTKDEDFASSPTTRPKRPAGGLATLWQLLHAGTAAASDTAACED